MGPEGFMVDPEYERGGEMPDEAKPCRHRGRAPFSLGLSGCVCGKSLFRVAVDLQADADARDERILAVEGWAKKARAWMAEYEVHAMGTNRILGEFLNEMPGGEHGPAWGTIYHESNEDLTAVGQLLMDFPAAARLHLGDERYEYSRRFPQPEKPK